MSETQKQQTIQMTMRLLKMPEDIVKADSWNKKLPLAECCGEALDDDGGRIAWKDLWDTKQDECKAGISMDNIIALDCLVMVPADMRPNPKTFGEFTRDHFRHLFGDGNILSTLYGEKQGAAVCHFFIYPLDKRQLNPLKWIDSYSHQLKRDYKDAYFKEAADLLGVDYNTVIAARNNGHSKYLDEFPKVNDRIEDDREMIYTTIPANSQIQTDYPHDKIQSISSQTIKAFTDGVNRGSYIKLNSGDMTINQYLKEASSYLVRTYPDMSAKDRSVVLQDLQGAAAGFYILDPLINDPKISDIKVTGPDKIRVKVRGARKTSNLHFIDSDDYFRFLKGLIQRYGLDTESDIHVFTDKYTNPGAILRLNMTMPAINSGFPTLHIRKISKKKNTIQDLIDMDVMDETTANYLLWAARNARGMVFTGKGSSGKTTMMNTLLDCTPSDASGLVIQESEELFSYKPEMTFEHITDQYDLKALAKNGLLTDIDYFIIGEIKGDEALDFIVAATTGNKAWCSVHGSSTKGGLDRLVDYIMKANKSKYTRPQALSMLQDLQVVVFMKNFKVVEISEITGYDPVAEKLTFKQVLKRDDLIAKTTPVTS